MSKSHFIDTFKGWNFKGYIMFPSFFVDLHNFMITTSFSQDHQICFVITEGILASLNWLDVEVTLLGNSYFHEDQIFIVC